MWGNAVAERHPEDKMRIENTLEAVGLLIAVWCDSKARIWKDILFGKIYVFKAMMLRIASRDVSV